MFIALAIAATPIEKSIVVDISEAKLYMYEGSEIADTMKVVVGKPSTPTPRISGYITYGVFNPYWNVPTEIALQKQLYNSPKYQILDGWSKDAKVVKTWKKGYRVRQLPGDTNAMGKVKFVFPNDLGIYLHDSPNKELFNSASRYYSAGCVRLSDADKLTRWIYGKIPKTTGIEQAVPVKQRIKVTIKD